jgi:hypothetical protein
MALLTSLIISVVVLVFLILCLMRRCWDRIGQRCPQLRLIPPQFGHGLGLRTQSQEDIIEEVTYKRYCYLDTEGDVSSQGKADEKMNGYYIGDDSEKVLIQTTRL